MRITSSRTTSTGAVSRANWTGSWKRLYGPLAVVLFLAVLPALAATPDDQYLRIYGMIEQADALDAKGQAGEALAKYREAQIALQGLQKEHRDWNTKLVAYRYNYLAQKVAGLSGKPPTPAAAKAPAVKPKARAESKATSPASGPQVKLLEPQVPPALVAVMVAEYAPAVVGVPVSSPVLDRLRPSGRPVALQVIGASPVAVSCRL